jgi:uncharacterized membrane protein YdjX (TVP38/TMEM64 family)
MRRDCDFTTSFEVQQPSLRTRPISRKLKLGTGLGLLILVAIAWVYIRPANLMGSAAVRRFYVEFPEWSLAIFIATYSVTMAAGIPTLPMNLAAGFFWGAIRGGIIAAIGASIGAGASFFIARFFVGRGLIRRFDSHAFKWLQKEIESRGWRFIAFVRVNPVFPTGLLNYLLGLTSISTGSYLITTTALLTPQSILIAWMGSQVGTNLTGNWASAVHIAIDASAVITTFFILRWVSRYINENRQSKVEKNNIGVDSQRN